MSNTLPVEKCHQFSARSNNNPGVGMEVVGPNRDADLERETTHYGSNEQQEGTHGQGLYLTV